jgi:hypothetical protein
LAAAATAAVVAGHCGAFQTPVGRV